MSVPTYLQSRAVPFALSIDGITYKNVVCKKLWGLGIEKTVVQDENDCGIATSVGNATKFSPNFEIVLNTTPDSNQFSANDIAGFANLGTLVYFKLTDGAGYYRQGSGYITSYNESAPFGGTVSATGTITGDGVLDTTP